MALDSYDDGVDRPGEAKPEQHFRGGRQDADAAAGKTELTEARTRQEYYEALRAADGRPVQANDNQRAPADARTDAPADARTDRSGWDAIDAEERPPPDAFRVSSERTVHILDGNSTGGGHRHGVGSPEKTEFPAIWDDKKIMGNVLDVARRPDSPPVLQHWNDRWVCSGTRESVEVSVVVLRSGEVWTAWPEEGSPGVHRNPRKETS
jgi:hypothetical protein